VNHKYDENRLICPECQEPYADVRVSLAIAYKKQSIAMFLDALQNSA
jgi:hypothetical protein